MKKIIVLLMFFMLSACGSSSDDSDSDAKKEIVQMEQGKLYSIKSGWKLNKTSANTRIRMTEEIARDGVFIELLSGSAEIKKD